MWLSRAGVLAYLMIGRGFFAINFYALFSSTCRLEAAAEIANIPGAFAPRFQSREIAINKFEAAYMCYQTECLSH